MASDTRNHVHPAELERIWSHLHGDPETSFQEFRTTEYLIGVLEAAGLQPRRFENISGFWVDVGPGEPTVGIRADMDALRHDVGGTSTNVHSCGHDANMAIVASVMLELSSRPDALASGVRAIFQPAEEVGGGAEMVAALGIADGLKYLFGVHLRPATELAYPFFAPSISHGACLFATCSIDGQDHHGARPHQGANAIEVALDVALKLKQIRVDPQVPSSVKLTMLRAGSGNLNVIPGKAQFGVDVRAQTNEAMGLLREGVARVCAQVAAWWGTDISVDFSDYVPAAEIGLEAERLLHEVITAEPGVWARPGIVTSGSDDFHFYTLRNPHLEASMLAIGADVQPGLHHPSMTFDHRAMGHAVSILEAACRRAASLRSDVESVPAGTSEQ